MNGEHIGPEREQLFAYPTDYERELITPTADVVEAINSLDWKERLSLRKRLGNFIDAYIMRLGTCMMGNMADGTPITWQYPRPDQDTPGNLDPDQSPPE